MAKNDIITWDTTDANNTDISGIPVTNATLIAQLDDIVRGQMGATARLTNTETIASSSTTNIAALAGQYVNVTGTTTITALGTVRTGIIKFVKFAAALTLTHNATSLILPTSANITTAAGDMAVLVSEGSGNWRCLSYSKADGTAVSVAVAAPPQGYLFGLTLSNNATDVVNDIDIAVGEAASGVSPSVLISLATALTKRADAVWAVGTNQGGRFHATLIDGWLYWYAIRNPTTGVSDVGCSDNPTTPTGGANYPATYTQFRYIGATNRVASALSLFLQTGNDFQFRSPIAEYNVTNPGTAAVLHSLTIPPILVKALYSVTIRDGSPAAATYAIVTSPLVNDIAPLITLHDARLDDVSPGALSIIKQVITSDRTVRVRQSNSDTGMVTTGTSFGWIDLKRQGL